MKESYSPTTMVLMTSNEVAYTGSCLNTVRFICGISTLQNEDTQTCYNDIYTPIMSCLDSHFSWDLVLVEHGHRLKLKELDNVVEDGEYDDGYDVPLTIHDAALKMGMLS